MNQTAPLQQEPQFYHAETGSLIGNDLSGYLRSKPSRPALNDNYLIKRFLMYPPKSCQTIFAGIRYIPPGHRYELDGAGRLTAMSRYWYPTHIKERRFRSEQDLITEFLSHYEKAVERTLQGGKKIGSHLSGGLDSGSVSFLAAGILKAQQRELTTFTSTEYFDTGERKNKFGNEAHYAAMTARSQPNIRPLYFNCPDISLLQATQLGVRVLADVPHGMGNLYWLFEIAEYAKEHGFDVVLNGQTGNATVSWKGTRWKDHARALAKEFWPPRFNLEKSLADARQIPGHFRPNAPERQVLNRDFLSRFTVGDLLRQDSDELDKELWGMKKFQIELLRPRHNPLPLFWHKLSAHYGTQYLDPTADVDLTAFCLSVPESYYAKNGGRNLIRTAMAGKMPDEVVFNRKKGLQSSDIRERWLREKKELLDLLNDRERTAKAAEYLDLKFLVRLAENMESIDYSWFGSISRAVGLIMLTEEYLS
ncbi:MAG: hypothetical protein RI973_98 [Bacteroidota bacterium]|jgi:asparagine synthase (glutamine-hydrolysing)